MVNQTIVQKKVIIALLCGMLGCILMCSGDWLMIYGSTTYHGETHWLTEGAAQIPSWRNALSMFVAFPAVIFYGVGLLTMTEFIKHKKQKGIYHYLTVFGMLPWLCIHLYVVMILYVFAMMSQSCYEAALPVAEALRVQFSWILPLGEAIMILPFLYWFYLQISGKTIFPKTMAYTNTLFIYGVLQIVKSLLPDTPFRLGFANGLMSESMFIWFGIMAVWSIVHDAGGKEK